MAAIRSGVTPACLARCFLRSGGKPSQGRQPLSNIWEHRSLQRSHLHTVFEHHSSSTRTLLGRRHRGKFVWVNAVAVRLNSTQIPSEDGPQSSSIPLTADPATAQPITEVISGGADSLVAPAAVSSAPPPVQDLSSTVVSADPAPVLTQPVVEQVADVAPTVGDVLLAAGGEQRLAELGLGSFTPVGLIQNILEFMHMDLGLPWWGAIVAGTVVARLTVFPIIVKGQREAAKLNNVMPQMNKLTNKIKEAQQSGNKFEFAKAHTNLSMFQKKHDVNPLRGFLVPLVQMPIFISFFIALRKMAYLPVPSLQTGGALWFPDLTIADPLYLLPLAVTGTMLLVLELGAESGFDNPNLRALKTAFRIMPFIILPLTINFPTAIFTYWLTSNCFSLGQVALLRLPVVRQRFGIPERIKHPAAALPPNEGLLETMRKSWKNAQLAQQQEEREKRIKNHLALAAKGPLRQTFTHNPLQQSPKFAAAPAQSKLERHKEQPWKDTIG